MSFIQFTVIIFTMFCTLTKIDIIQIVFANCNSYCAGDFYSIIQNLVNTPCTFLFINQIIIQRNVKHKDGTKLKMSVSLKCKL